MLQLLSLMRRRQACSCMCRLQVLGAGRALIQPVSLAAELYHQPSLLLHVLGVFVLNGNMNGNVQTSADLSCACSWRVAGERPASHYPDLAGSSMQATEIT